MLRTRTRTLAGVAVLALSAVGALPGALAGEPMAPGEVVATPDPVVVGETTVVTPATPADNCVIPLRPAGDSVTLELYWQIKDLANPSDLVESGQVDVEPDGSWAVPIDTTGFNPGDYDFFAECVFPLDLEVQAAGAGGGELVMEYEGLFEVIAPAAPEVPETPTEPPAALPVEAAPDFTG
jgi:hypothetical protein